MVGVATILVDCDNCEHCDNYDHISRAWVFQGRGPMFNSRPITGVSGRASDLKCTCPTPVSRLALIHDMKNQVSQGLQTIKEGE